MQHQDLLTRLPRTLEWTGEFGSELVLFMPFCRWLSSKGILQDRTICTYKGMRSFYEGLEYAEITEKSEARRYVPPARRPWWLPIRNEHTFDNRGKSPFLLFDDIRGRFSNRRPKTLPPTANKPMLIIHNKYNEEWGHEPINYISGACLARLFEILTATFTLVYIRHSSAEAAWGFSPDANAMKELDDQEALREHPEVYEFRSLYLAETEISNNLDINTFKNMLYSGTYYFITTQGGGAHHIAMFSGSRVLVLHRKGQEERWAYSKGYYNFLAPRPPTVVVCSNENVLLDEAAILSASVSLTEAQ